MDKHCEGAERALGSIIAKMIKFGGLPFSVFTLLYKACVTTVSDYSAAAFWVWRVCFIKQSAIESY